MPAIRCSNCGGVPLLETDSGQQLTDVWGYARVRCPRCGDLVVEYAAPSWINDGPGRMEQLTFAAITSWNERNEVRSRGC